MNNRVQQNTYSTGPKKFGGSDYKELLVRDRRGMIIGYALLDPRDQGFTEEFDRTLEEFEQDFQVGR